MQCISIPVCVEFIVALTQKNQSLGPILIGPHTHWKHSMVFHIIQRGDILWRFLLRLD